MLLSHVQQSDSDMSVHVSVLFQILCWFRLIPCAIQEILADYLF